MAESPSPTPEQPLPESDDSQYWCYHCDKRVSVETHPEGPDILCLECKHGFVESIHSPSLAPPSTTSDPVDDPHFESQFLRVLRLLAESARDEDAPPPPSRNRSSGDDFLRVEFEDWDDDEESSNNNNNDEDDVDDGVEFRDEGEEHEGAEEHEDGLGVEDLSGDEAEEYLRRRSMRNRIRDLTSRIRDLATGTRSRRNRILDWADILMGLEDNSIELRLQVPDSDRFFGNPGDYVDAADYEALLLTLAESDGSGRRGAPPAAKSAVESLPTVEIVSEDQALVCAICKDMVGVGSMAKQLPCGHQYHGDCIVPWLGSRNSCPVCRFELPTDDQDYEEEKKKVIATTANGASGSGGTDAVSGLF
ncbi:hypothetical protein K1719_033007 [Acacia pycnantha]|nr:hypothetical protein K1719_033007 [Acacia pycnantha]